MTIKHVFGFICLFILCSACSPQHQTQAFGILERDRIALTSSASEILISSSVTEGEKVTKGQVIAQLASDKQTAILAQATAEHAKAQANLNKLLAGSRLEDIESAHANLESAQARLSNAQKQLSRILNLSEHNAISKSEKDNAIAEKEAALAQFHAAEQGLKKLNAGFRHEDIQAASAEVDALAAKVKLEQIKLKELTIVATRDGILDSLPYNPGERVSQNATIAVIQSAGAPFARVYIPQPYMARLILGQKVSIAIDGFNQTVEGNLRWLSVDPVFTPYQSMSESDRSRLVYLAEIDLPDSVSHLPSGIPVQMQLEP